eukprot:5199369-Amphidinium_carterae.1
MCIAPTTSKSLTSTTTGERDYQHVSAMIYSMRHTIVEILYHFYEGYHSLTDIDIYAWAPTDFTTYDIDFESVLAWIDRNGNQWTTELLGTLATTFLNDKLISYITTIYALISMLYPLITSVAPLAAGGANSSNAKKPDYSHRLSHDETTSARTKRPTGAVWRALSTFTVSTGRLSHHPQLAGQGENIHNVDISTQDNLRSTSTHGTTMTLPFHFFHVWSFTVLTCRCSL